MGSWFNSSNRQFNAGSTLPPDYVFNLPSWVPNFGTLIPPTLHTAEIMRTIQYKYYDALHGTCTNLHFGLDSTLHITGQLVGMVKLAIKVPSTRDDDMKTLLNDCLDSIKLEIGTFDTQRRREFLEAAMGALYFDRQPDWKKLSAVKNFSIESWIEEQESEGQIRIAVDSSVFVATTERSFFITEDGGVGFCPPDTKPGDEVWVFYGGNASFMVRPLGGSDAGSYCFLGDCYLHGVMFGEVFADQPWTPNMGTEIILK